MTLLTIFQDACDELKLDRPTTVVSNTDQNVRQLLALSNRSGKQLAQRHAFQELVTEATHTTVAAELQGTVESIMPGFNWLLYETLWNRTTRDSVEGPLFPSEWQFLKASNVTGPYPEFRIRNKSLYMIPAPTASQTIGLEYVSRYWCESSGGTDQQKWAADTDVGILPEDMLTIDLIWRFKAANGIDYAEDMRQAEFYINNAIARSGGRRKINMGDSSRLIGDVIRVPDGDWSP